MQQLRRSGVAQGVYMGVFGVLIGITILVSVLYFGARLLLGYRTGT